MRLNLGCGSLPEPGWVNVDVAALPDVDVAHDLDVFPWPWADCEAERIKAYDIFEHIDRPLEFVRECHRILRTGGILDVHTCFWRSENAFTDPTHRRASTFHTFDYWVPGTYLNGRYGPAYTQGCHFAYAEAPHLDGTELAVVLRRL